MQVDYLIIGQGISGTFLSYYLQKENKRFVVIDDQFKDAPSRIAAGVINPVTGRRMVTVWMADELLHYAWESYQKLGVELDIAAIAHKNIIDFFPNPFMRESFLKKMEEKDKFVHTFPEQNQFNPYLNYEFGCGEIRPAYIVHLENILPAWRTQLNNNQLLREENFSIEELIVKDDEIVYQDITASKIIFCDGNSSINNSYFSKLPFAPSKGEAVIVQIPGLPDQHIYKKSMSLVPLTTPDLFWLGSSYQWEFEHPNPTPEFLNQSTAVLKEWLKIPFTIVEHLSGVRCATLERRPFVGLHPLHPSIGLLNGMGTKGCSLAPFFAKQLVDHLLYNEPIVAQADTKRFTKTLGR